MMNSSAAIFLPSLAEAAGLAVARRTPESIDDLLDRVMHAILDVADVAATVGDLMAGLNALRAAAPAEWPAIIKACQEHALYTMFGLDPITSRARAKPRGYAGDAVMIDYIYRGLTEQQRAELPPLGRALFDATIASPSAVAVRDRRDLLTERIDATAKRVEQARVLSLACGHLREAEKSRAVRWRELGALTAIDQDADSLAVVAMDHADRPEVAATLGSVRDLLRGSLKPSGYDLVYAAGLYDYLPEAVAKKLTRVLFETLAPGGELLVGNFKRDYATIGYTEAFMDWHLICRSEAEVGAFADLIPRDQIRSIRTHSDRTNCIAYVTVVRA
jgi:extracellular factor (EF) 3-hydroxypalmitic acid methyl ester biosynthesis protein